MQIASRTGARGGRPAGFSLIEILVVIAIIGLLITLAVGPVQNAMESAKVTACRKHLTDIGVEMRIWKEQRNKGRWPKDSGIRFLMRLHEAGAITGRNCDKFLCPATPDANDTGASGETGSSYEDWENLDPLTISYAGRDQDAYPIKGGDESLDPIASDDNDGRPNHRFLTNILFADGSTDSFDIRGGKPGEIEVRTANPDIETTGLPIGPDCPYEPLQVLRID
jgi:prepilin-type N-terminal cleavage/methylation domain-containing protein